MTPLPASNRLISLFTTLFFLVAIAIFAIQIGLLVDLWLKTYHPLPWHDEWDTVEFLRQVYLKPDSVKPWLALHNEHRLVTPRLIFFIDFWIFNGNFLFTFFISASLALGTAAIFIYECTVLKTNAIVLNLLRVSIVSMLLCGQQASNFLWAFQVQWFLVHFFTVAGVALVIAASRAHISGKKDLCKTFLILSLVTTIAANYSTASGNLSWISTCIATFFLRNRLPKPILLAMVFFGLISVGVYSLGFELSGTGVGSINALRKDPLLGLTFLLAFFGAPFAPFGRWTAVFAGSIYFGCMTIIFLRLLIGRFTVKSTLDIFSISLLAFVASVGLVTMVGRFSLGVDGGFESRFASVMSIGWSALALLLFSYIINMQKKWPQFLDEGLCACFSIVVALIYCGVGIGGFLKPPYDYLPLVEIKRSAVSALIGNSVDSRSLEQVGFPSPINLNSPSVDFLRKTQKSIFSRSLSNVSKQDVTLTAPFGSVIMFNTKTPDGIKRMSGLSIEESFGRWSNSKLIVIEFNQALPNAFEVDLVVGGYSSNIGSDAKVIVGSEEKKIKIRGGINELQMESLKFQGVGNTNMIAIVVPHPTVPSRESSGSLDQRPLGIVLQSIAIRPLP